MPYAPEFSESTAKVTNNDRAAASENLLKDAQIQHDHKFQKNLKDDSNSINGDEAIKKMFNGKEVHKMLKDFVINNEPDRCFEPKGPKNLLEALPKSIIDTKDLKFLHH